MQKPSDVSRREIRGVPFDLEMPFEGRYIVAWNAEAEIGVAVPAAAFAADAFEAIWLVLEAEISHYRLSIASAVYGAA